MRCDFTRALQEKAMHAGILQKVLLRIDTVPRGFGVLRLQRLRFDCDTTLPAKVRVVAAERELSSALDALLSMRAPV